MKHNNTVFVKYLIQEFQWRSILVKWSFLINLKHRLKVQRFDLKKDK